MSNPIIPYQTPFGTANEFKSITFHGDVNEYYGIWFTNVFLTIVTLGIYSAWAKVRRLQYFFGNTDISGYSLGYHASGIQILKGRLIAIAVLWGISILYGAFPNYSIAIQLGVVALLTWVINRSLKFRNRVTSWRNLQFNWQGTYWSTFLNFLLYPFLGVITLGLFWPMVTKRYYQYFAKHHSFGITDFDVSLSTGELYKEYMKSVVVLVVPAFIFVIASYGIYEHYEVSLTQVVAENKFTIFIISWIRPFSIWLLIAAVWFGSVLYFARCRNLLMQALTLGNEVKFKSELNPNKYLFITVTNALAIVGSLGLLIPWAAIRKYRYLAEQTSFHFIRNENDFIDEETARVHAFGEEFVGFEGIDISV